MSIWPVTRPRPSDLPQAIRLHSGRPPLAADWTAMTSAVSHLAGWKYRQHWSSCWEQDATSTVPAWPDDAEIPAGPPSGIVTHSMAIMPSPHARHLLVGMTYQADSESSTNPSITVSLQKLDGSSNHDDGIIFDFEAGTLPTAKGALHIGLGAYMLHPLCIVVSETSTNDPAATAGSPSRPRLLVVPSAARGQACQVEFQATFVRLLSATIWEFPGANI